MTDEIWKEFRDRLKRFILRRVQNKHDAEDILQDVLYKIHSSIHKLEDGDKLQAWVYQIARNTVIDYYRHRKVIAGLSEVSEDSIDEPIKADVNDEIISCLKSMIDGLPEKYRQAIILADIKGLTQKEIAENLGLSLSGAKSRVQRAREKLKETLLECCHFELDRLGNPLEYQQKEQNCPYCAGEPAGE